MLGSVLLPSSPPPDLSSTPEFMGLKATSVLLHNLSVRKTNPTAKHSIQETPAHTAMGRGGAEHQKQEGIGKSNVGNASGANRTIVYLPSLQVMHRNRRRASDRLNSTHFRDGAETEQPCIVQTNEKTGVRRRRYGKAQRIRSRSAGVHRCRPWEYYPRCSGA
ncbi:hypothetical protein GN956_G16980 [Arapaima gigas]